MSKSAKRRMIKEQLKSEQRALRPQNLQRQAQPPRIKPLALAVRVEMYNQRMRANK